MYNMRNISIWLGLAQNIFHIIIEITIIFLAQNIFHIIIEIKIFFLKMISTAVFLFFCYM